LSSIVGSAQSGDTIVLADGIYDLGGQSLILATSGVTLRGESRDSAAVRLESGRTTAEIVVVAASDVTIAHMTLVEASDHAIHVYPWPGSSGDVTGLLVYDVTIIDSGQQGLKINADGDPPTRHIDDGEVACSTFTMTRDGAAYAETHTAGFTCYTGGIDAHAARNWLVRDNRFDGWYCDAGLAEHAIHFWKGCRDIVVLRNVIHDSARGIGFGLGNGTPGRVYPDQDAICPGVSYPGTIGGAIVGNVIVASDANLFASGAGFDTGIGAELACGGLVIAHNTIFSHDTAGSGIEWRFGGTDVEILDNLSSHRLWERTDQGDPTERVEANLIDVTANLFVDAAANDFHLAPTAAGAIDMAVPASLDDQPDWDGDPRGASPDIGADELAAE
jgi:hypothetical protein